MYLPIWTREEDNKTVFQFYSKPMSSNTALQLASDMPENMKVASLNQEVIRRMLNTSEDLEDSKRMVIVDDFAKKNQKLWLLHQPDKGHYDGRVMKGSST